MFDRTKREVVGDVEVWRRGAFKELHTLQVASFISL
jgi:hypothetical protein